MRLRRAHLGRVKRPVASVARRTSVPTREIVASSTPRGRFDRCPVRGRSPPAQSRATFCCSVMTARRRNGGNSAGPNRAKVWGLGRGCRHNAPAFKWSPCPPVHAKQCRGPAFTPHDIPRKKPAGFADELYAVQSRYELRSPPARLVNETAAFFPSICELGECDPSAFEK